MDMLADIVKKHIKARGKRLRNVVIDGIEYLIIHHPALCKIIKKDVEPIDVNKK